MPRLSFWMVRLSLIYLLAGFLLGGVLLAHKGLPFWPGAWALLPPHIEFLLVGWLVQLALGVAYWILPRFQGGSRGHTRLAFTSAVLLNLGIMLVALRGFSPNQALLGVSGRTLELLAAVLFLVHAWPRVKPFFPGGP